jgi:hypothetical protein
MLFSISRSAYIFVDRLWFGEPASTHRRSLRIFVFSRWQGRDMLLDLHMIRPDVHPYKIALRSQY